MNRVHRLQTTLSSLRAVAADHRGQQPRALQLCIADFERQLEDALRAAPPPTVVAPVNP